MKKTNDIQNSTEQVINYTNSLTPGSELTIDHDTISQSGHIYFKKGQKVKVMEVWSTEGKWSNIYNIWIPKVVHGVKLENEYGIYLLSLFTETKEYCR